MDKYFFDGGHHTLAGAAFFATRVDEIGWLTELIDATERNDGVAADDDETL